MFNVQGLAPEEAKAAYFSFIGAVQHRNDYPSDPAARKAEMDIEKSVRVRISTLRDLPSLPHVLVKLMEACNDKDGGLEDIVYILTMTRPSAPKC